MRPNEEAGQQIKGDAQLVKEKNLRMEKAIRFQKCYILPAFLNKYEYQGPMAIQVLIDMLYAG